MTNDGVPPVSSWHSLHGGGGGGGGQHPAQLHTGCSGHVNLGHSGHVS